MEINWMLAIFMDLLVIKDAASYVVGTSTCTQGLMCLENNKVLHNNEITHTKVRSLLECVRDCLQEVHCKSINFYEDEETICRLHNETKTTKPGDFNSFSDSGVMKYYDFECGVEAPAWCKEQAPVSVLPASCDGEWEEVWPGFCVKLQDDAKTWSDARSECQAAGGDLATIHDQEQYDALVTAYKQRIEFSNAWIGLIRTGEYQWEWLDPSSSYENWDMSSTGSDQAAQACGGFYPDDYFGGIIKNTCAYTRKFICRLDLGT
ncbi:unnamed protein product [Owenia fusiformis]|uniref:Uncharacterized protein n=1 Tax=Owenia fusiformis TaxID=6347 RepID=A0A8J1TAX1_OWEFU|nr:unnamed protein product [Owenia fusiformis]